MEDKNIVPLFPVSALPEAGASPEAPLNADQLRHKILEQFNLFQPHLQAYHEYAQRVAVLSMDYHQKRLEEEFPGVLEELTLVASLDARETPKSLDTKIAQLKQNNVVLKRIVFDRVQHTFHLFV